ncbi:MAG TPA: alpha/beta hydrolase domain-containing protein, partial [Acidimicrobiia bacterium]|nr:alpha/beta hydrolase domain-containing protein [Acidimicrobiia bacterium]
MSSRPFFPSICRSTKIAAAVAVALGLAATAAEARVTRIIVDTTTSSAASVDGVAYKTLTGRAFGELDPKDPHNTLITDIGLASTNANGNVEYIATFTITMPSDPSKASGVVWHDVPNRGRKVALEAQLKGVHDIELDSGWQGDNSGGTAVPANAASPTPITPVSTDWVKTPVLMGVKGRILARIVNVDGDVAAPLKVQNAPVPYFPVDATDNSHDTLTIHTHETVNGIITEGGVVPNQDWKYCATGGTFDNPGTITALPVNVCLRDGFDATKLYQLVYDVKDPYVLGAGTAAFRDVMSFFRYAQHDDAGTANPLAGVVKKAIIRGVSQSGNFTRHFIFLGMNEDESGRIVHDGAWPLIAGRRVANNSRWGQPDGVLELYQMGSEGPQWWHSFPDQVRNLHPGGILDRCENTNTCPKIVETFGGAEVFALKMTTSWVGTDPKTDIPLPDNVRRYYLPSSTHGGGNGEMKEHPSARASCPGNNYGGPGNPPPAYLANPVPSTELVDRMEVAMRDWLLNGTQPPPSVWPHLKGANGERTLVEPTMATMGFPHGVPGVPDSIFLPENFVFPIFDYDWGPQFDEFNATGVPTNEPPPIRHVIKMLVPAVDADGNELGGVPTVQVMAPLATYLGWNITAGPGSARYDGRPFHAGQVCNYIGGMVPFAKTKAQRVADGDPRLSLEERYGTHAGYVAAVKAAADNAACQGYLVAGPAATAMGAKCAAPSLAPGVNDDWASLVNEAMSSNVCNQPGD